MGTISRNGAVRAARHLSVATGAMLDEVRASESVDRSGEEGRAGDEEYGRGY